uniref:Uncharacterized protein n=1 Tax=Compsopogon caeruleus TaxID=31354 RepID=A0A6T6DFS2_9RHOD|mmetsp:Transcript_892/g.1925  ORF Transcript_892/g.1925 Transcript_892/m.1925 type:complete len:131 (+) Transcript_892:187-579(+)
MESFRVGIGQMRRQWRRNTTANTGAKSVKQILKEQNLRVDWRSKDISTSDDNWDSFADAIPPASDAPACKVEKILSVNSLGHDRAIDFSSFTSTSSDEGFRRTVSFNSMVEVVEFDLESLKHRTSRALFP